MCINVLWFNVGKIMIKHWIVWPHFDFTHPWVKHPSKEVEIAKKNLVIIREHWEPLDLVSDLQPTYPHHCG